MYLRESIAYNQSREIRFTCTINTNIFNDKEKNEDETIFGKRRKRQSNSQIEIQLRNNEHISNKKKGKKRSHKELRDQACQHPVKEW